MKNRNQIEEKYKWDLSKILDVDNIEKYKEEVKILLSEVEKFKGNITSSSDNLYNFYQKYEQLNRLVEKLYMYAHLNYDADTTDTKAQTLYMEIEKLYQDLSEKLTFVVPEILECDYNVILDYIEKDDRLKQYSFDLEQLFRNKPHTLSLDEENIITLATNAMGTGSEVFDNIDNTDIDLGKIKDENNNEVELTNANYNKYMNSKDRRVRIDAFNAMYNYYKRLIHTIAASLKGNVKENFFMSKVRKFESPIKQSLFYDNIDISVYDSLIEAVHNNLDTMYEYLSLKKKALKLDEMHMYDIYVDIVDNKTHEYPFEQGKKMIFEALKPLGENYLNDLNKAFDERWIDIYPNKGKSSGAYSSGSYDTYPYLLLNYTDTIDSVSTLVHELGHSMHSYYSNKNQNYTNASYPIFLAEIASTTNEILLNDYLYKNAKTKEEKILYLTELLEKIRTTIYRQTMFAEFEKIIHEKEDKGIPLTEEELSNTYLELNKLYYGNNVVSDDLIKYEWARIPHFYTSFYVYKYATGLSCAIKIATDIINNKENAKENYLDFLSSGGSDYPLNILKKTGIDMTKPDTINDALKVFKEKVEELKELL